MVSACSMPLRANTMVPRFARDDNRLVQRPLGLGYPFKCGSISLNAADADERRIS